jgi:tetraacyldisaccharide 4'-kinase
MRLFLYPFALLYGFVVMVRNFLYNSGILPAAKFKIPVILVGNLSTGGTGKTPHVEFLVQLLNKNYHIATLSRGYGRRTKGYREVDSHSSAWEVGDEPLLYKSRHPELTVTVCEDRAVGIRTILKTHPKTDVIIMDDGFQHRRVKPGFSMLLTSWADPFINDHLLPAGNLREPGSGSQRADCIVVTRTPSGSASEVRKALSDKIASVSQRPVYFSSLKYSNPEPVFRETAPSFPAGSIKPVLFAGIADPASFMEHVTEKFGVPDVILFGDHHDYTEKEMEDLFERYQSRMLTDKNAVLITTEKDAMRLRTVSNAGVLKMLPLYFIPIDVVLHPGETTLETRILTYVAENKRNR